jgi:hypothetical protein
VFPEARGPNRGDAFHRVRLSDGTEGNVNSGFLAPLGEWDSGIAALPCTAGQGPTDVSVSTPSSGDASAILALHHTMSGNCDRQVIVLGIGTYSFAEFDEFETANVLGGGDVRVTSGGTGVTVERPGSISSIYQGAADVHLSDALTMSVIPITASHAATQLEVRFLRRSARVAHAVVWSHPARLVVDVVSTLIDTELDYTPLIDTGPTILGHPVDPSADKIGVTAPFSVTGDGG